MLAAPRLIVLEIVPERIVRSRDARPQSEDLGSFLEIFVGQTVEKRERVTAQLPPELGIQILEDVVNLRVPGPVEVTGKFVQSAAYFQGVLLCGAFLFGAGNASRTPIPL